jgi:hypothetical protein
MNTKNYGRVWKIDVTADKNDLKKEREDVSRIMKQRFAGLNESQLGGYLKHTDMRIRQRAQIELAMRGEKAYPIFKMPLLKKRINWKGYMVSGVWVNYWQRTKNMQKISWLY